jgi:hypothetical protein
MTFFSAYYKLFIQMALKKAKTQALVLITRTQAYQWLLYNIIPYVRMSFYYTTMRGWKYHRGYNKLKPGHMVLTTDRKKLSTLIIGGEFAHAGLCISKDQVFECAEMTHKNFTHSTFSDMAYEADRVVIIECTAWDEEYVDKVLIPTCRSFEGKKYDVLFTLGNEFLYCSEMIYEADKERRLQANTEDLVALGKPYLSPDGLYKARNVKIIWDSDKEEL